MKKLLLFSICVLLSISYTQSQTKTKPAENAPEQQDIQQMMKEAQKAMESMSPEDKKMLENMGVKMPSMNSMPQLTDQQIQNASNGSESIVPVKDVARINKALSISLSDAEMPAYVDKVNVLVTKKMKPDYVIRADEIYNSLSQNSTSPYAMSQYAIGVLIEGQPMLALYLLGKSCRKLPDADNLNNYAAVLTNFGAEQLAIPILINLNTHYPQNSTILNNIGQAWFGLGDIEKAEENVDKAIRIYAYHPQANFTKCLIEESKGHIPQAVEAAKKSIKYGYSPKKASKLEKLGYKLKSEDVDWEPSLPHDDLGLAKFKWPAYPQSVEESSLLELEWEDFKEKCNSKISELQVQQASLEKQMSAQQEIRTKQTLQASQFGMQVPLFPEMTDKAIVKLGPTVQGFDAESNYIFADKLQSVIVAQGKLDELENIERTDMEALNKKYKDQFGEGKPNPYKEACKDENEIRNKFLGEANTLMQHTERVYLNAVSSQTDKLLYYRKYTQWPDEYAWTTVVAQISWLTMISRQVVSFRNKSEYCKYAQNDEKPKMDSLQNFDDVACKYISTTDLGCFKITSQCSRLIGEFDCGGVTINARQNDETNKFSGNIYVGASKSISAGKSPLSPEAELTAAVGIELSESGKTDFVGKVGANVNIAGQTVVGVEGRASVNSGPSMSGQGMLSGIDK
jgi:tetratricopeptide (TPR) repeat protein